MILGNTYVACFVGKERHTLSIPMEMGLVKKYDTLSQQHDIYLVVRPHNADNVEALLVHNGYPLVQEVCPFEDEPLISAVTKLVQEANVATLIKLARLAPQTHSVCAARMQ